MSVDFVANEAEGWTQSGANPASTTGMDTTRNPRGGMNIANSGFSGESPIVAGRTDGAICWRFWTNGSFTSGTSYYVWENSAGTDVLRIRASAANTFLLEFWNGATWTAVGIGQVQVASVSYHAELTYENVGSASGSLTLRFRNVASGVVDFSWSASGLNLTSMVDIAQGKFAKHTAGTYVMGEYVMGDFDPEGIETYSRVGTATGTDNTGATGTYTAIDEGGGTSAGYDDTDFIALAADGDRYSFTMPARSFSGHKVLAIALNYRARRGATGPAQVRPYLKIGGTRYYAATQALTASFVSAYTAVFTVNPATASDWVTADAEDVALEFGFEAET